MQDFSEIPTFSFSLLRPGRAAELPRVEFLAGRFPGEPQLAIYYKSDYSFLCISLYIYKGKVTKVTKVRLLLLHVLNFSNFGNFLFIFI